MTFVSEQSLSHEIYDRLALWGVNIDAIKEFDLTIEQLEAFYRGIRALLERYPDWLGEAN